MIPQDIEIAQGATLRPIQEIAAEIGVRDEELVPYGRDVAKIDLGILRRLTSVAEDFRYVAVTGITPTPFGEGKTTTTVGLTQGLGRIGKRAACAIRQPSLGPTFGIKGGAAGGGYSQVVPMERFNLHLTGDTHAVSIAHNLIAAAVDARIYHEGRWSDAYFEKRGMRRLNIDPYQVSWKRVLDVSDRALRSIVTGLGDTGDGPMRQSGFDIAVASELMAILALSTDLGDMRARIGRTVVAFDRTGKPISCDDLEVAGAATALMRDALSPNLLQTLEGQPAFVHAGPFANIAHGNSSIMADLVASRLGGFLVTESGFGSDMGLEKFFDIKCRASGLRPHAVVMVVTVRAVKSHGGGPALRAGVKPDAAYSTERLDLVEEGLANLRAHLAISRRFGVPVVVAVNAFPSDTAAELEMVRAAAVEAGAVDAVVCTHFTDGGAGAEALAEAVATACESPSKPELLYPSEMPIRDKIELLATGIYGAARVEYGAVAEEAIDRFTELGWGSFPICMAKTPLSLSHDPALRNAPRGFTFPVPEVRAAVGAGFLYPLSGSVRIMPGLPAKPAFMSVDVDTESGLIRGLF
ncbi:MAG: formate--tetrahydrofolate ligase [Spirochaetaceae bacterium]|nr:MAG: formate--tetrahydrofolate ligase [Spirochaetaceae bacterium]